MTDGLGTAFSTCILTNENRYYGVSDDEFFSLNKSLLGIDRYHIISNFEKRGIQHIDCFMKILDEDRILVLQPPIDHELYPVYENIVRNELSEIKNYYGRYYKIVRMKTDVYHDNLLAAYSNSLILNKTIYVPLFQKKEDTSALTRWAELMPGYTIKGFDFDLKNETALTLQMKERYTDYGWNHGDALHCRTRAIFDKHMLFVTVRSLDDTIMCNDGNTVFVTVMDYSKIGLFSDKIILHWRISGVSEWQKIIMEKSDSPNQFEAIIPCQKSGTAVEYFITASSKSGKEESKPRTAPVGYYKTVFK